jgi:hypothetical protein
VIQIYVDVVPLRTRFAFSLANRVARWYAFFQTKNPYSGKFGRTLKKKMLVHFLAVCNILQSFGMFYPFWGLE